MDASIPYKYILFNHTPQVVATLERTGIVSHFSVKDVFSALSTRWPYCHVCGKVGMYLWIPECIRCCFLCMEMAPELMPIGERDAKAAFGLTSGMKRVPTMLTLPGVYTIARRPCRQRRRLVSRKKARQAAIIVHGGEDGFANYINGISTKTKIACERRITALNTGVRHITRYMTTIPLPYFNANSRETHIGLACRGCEFAVHLSPLPPYDNAALIQH